MCVQRKVYYHVRKGFHVRAHRLIIAIVLGLFCVRSVAAQQRPLLTEDPEVVGAGALLIEGGIAAAHDQRYPLSGLEGNLWRVPMLGVSVGLSSIAELQIDGGLVNTLAISKRTPAPLSGLVTVTGDHAHDVEDIVIGTKIRLLPETAHHPSVGFRFATRLPNATNESGLGLDTTDFYASLLGAKTVQSIRIVGNLGIGILGDPVDGHAQNDVVMYGASVARAMNDKTELVAELNGRISVRDVAFPGTESRGLFTVGARYTRGAGRFDAGLFVGLTSVDPTIGFTVGYTHVLRAFNIP